MSSSNPDTATANAKPKRKVTVAILSQGDFNKVLENQERRNNGFSESEKGRKAYQAYMKNSGGGVKKAHAFSEEEDKELLRLYKKHGTQWMKIKRAKPDLFSKRSSTTLRKHCMTLLQKEVTGATTKAKKGRKKGTRKKKRKVSITDYESQSDSDSECDYHHDSDSDSDTDLGSEIRSEVVTVTTNANRDKRAAKRQKRMELQKLTEEFM